MEDQTPTIGVGHRVSHILYYWLPPLLWVGLMTLSSRLSFRDGAPDWVSGRDKLVHAVYFGGFALLLLRSLRGHLRWHWKFASLAAFLFTVGYGGWDEYQQGFDPNRMRDIGDFIADVIGALSVFAVALLTRLLPPSAPSPSPPSPCDV
jgi:VanZ family protein